VEGAEYEMLNGADKILTAFPDSVWIVEIVLSGNYPRGQNPNFLKTFERFWFHGYEAYTINEDSKLVSRNDVLIWIKKSDLGGDFLFTKHARA